ncbi:MAG: thioredoxin family protein [Planctomycetota bacterium]
MAEIYALGYRVERVNIRVDRNKADKYMVRRGPTFVYVEDGKEIGRRTGNYSKDALVRLCHGYWF